MLGVGLPSIVAAPLVHHLLRSRPLPLFAQAALLAWPPPLCPPFVMHTVRPTLSRPSPCPPPPRPALPRPPLCAHAGGTGGTVRHPPPFRSRSAVPSTPVAPRPACTSCTPFARTLGAGRTERPPSLSVREQAPPPGLLPLPRLTRHPPRARALPHPLCECGERGRRGSAHLPLPFAPPPGLCHPRPPVYDAPCLARPPPPLHTCWGGTRDGASPPLVRGQSPPPRLRPSPVPHHARTPSTPLACIPEAQEGRVCAQWEGHAEGATRQGRAARKGSTREGAMHQGRTARKGSAREGEGHGTMGGATREANGGGAKGVRTGRGATRAKGAARERRGGAKTRLRDLVCSQVREKGEGVRAGAGYNWAGGRRVNERRRAPFPHPRAQ